MVNEALIATTDNITLSGAQTLQGVSLVATNIVLVAGQTDGTQNGPYVVQTGAWTRHTDHDVDAEFVRPWEIFIREGDYANWRFQFTNPATPTLGTSVLNFDPCQRAEVLSEALGIDINDSANTIGLTEKLESQKTFLSLEATVNIDGTIDFATNSALVRDFIRGVLYKTGATSIATVGGVEGGVDLGWAAVFGNNLTLEQGTNMFRTGLSLTPNTLYYVYVYNESNGFPTMEVVTTPPSSRVAFTGRAKSSTGTFGGTPDYSRRYFQTLRSDGSGNLYNWMVEGEGNEIVVSYLEDSTASPFRAVSASAATANTIVNLSPSGLKLAPPTARTAILKVTVNATSGVVLDNSEMSTSPAAGTGFITVPAVTRAMYLRMPLDSSQSFRVAKLVAGGATSIDVLGYVDRR